MKSDSILKPIKIESFRDTRGNLDVAELQLLERFETKRIYSISNVPSGLSRGAHAHKTLEQIFFALTGQFTLTVTGGLESEVVVVRAQETGYYLPAGYWRDLSEFSHDALCLVLASEHYDEGDYIHSYEEYLKWKKL